MSVKNEVLNSIAGKIIAVMQEKKKRLPKTFIFLGLKFEFKEDSQNEIQLLIDASREYINKFLLSEYAKRFRRNEEMNRLLKEGKVEIFKALLLAAMGGLIWPYIIQFTLNIKPGNALAFLKLLEKLDFLKCYEVGKKVPEEVWNGIIEKIITHYSNFLNLDVTRETVDDELRKREIIGIPTDKLYFFLYFVFKQRDYLDLKKLVAVLIYDEDKVLLVEYHRPFPKGILPKNCELWYFPAVYMEKKDKELLREKIKEKFGFDIEPEGELGTYRWSRPGKMNEMIELCVYIAKPVRIKKREFETKFVKEDGKPAKAKWFNILEAFNIVPYIPTRNALRDFATQKFI